MHGPAGPVADGKLAGLLQVLEHRSQASWGGDPESHPKRWRRCIPNPGASGRGCLGGPQGQRAEKTPTASPRTKAHIQPALPLELSKALLQPFSGRSSSEAQLPPPRHEGNLPPHFLPGCREAGKGEAQGGQQGALGEQLSPVSPTALRTAQIWHPGQPSADSPGWEGLGLLRVRCAKGRLPSCQLEFLCF